VSVAGYILLMFLQYFLKFLSIFPLNTAMGQTESLYTGSRPIFEIIRYFPHLMSKKFYFPLNKSTPLVANEAR
jgi:hypothetical protein